MYTIQFCNSAGELDSKTAATPEQAAQVAADLILSAGMLYRGDQIVVTSDNDEDE